MCAEFAEVLCEGSGSDILAECLAVVEVVAVAVRI